MATLRTVSSSLFDSVVEPCFSVRLVLPFVAVLTGKKGVSEAQLRKICGMEGDARLPISVTLRWLDSAVRVCRDPDLGLNAAFLAEYGNYDVIEFAGSSASTWGESLNQIIRYIRLVNEAADFSLSVDSGRARLRLGSLVPLNRAATDFQCACLMAAATRWLGSLNTFEVWFDYPKPEDLTVYRKLFGTIPLQFSAHVCAISFDARLLDKPIKQSDPSLNNVLQRHAEYLVSKLPEPDRLTARVRNLLLDRLQGGNTAADEVAEQLGMSRRTLLRYLEREGTTFKDLLEGARREAAFQALAHSTNTISEIAALLGYSETAAFSRAFKRWAGQSPVEYRRLHSSPEPSGA